MTVLIVYSEHKEDDMKLTVNEYIQACDFCAEHLGVLCYELGNGSYDVFRTFLAMCKHDEDAAVRMIGALATSRIADQWMKNKGE